MSKEVSNEEINDKELESPVTDKTGESRADETPGQTQKIEDEEPHTDEPEEELPPPTPEELKQLRADAAKAGEYYERLLRQVAETDNLRKRLAKEKHDAIRYANESLIKQLLPTMDSFDMAMMAVSPPTKLPSTHSRPVSKWCTCNSSAPSRRSASPIDATGQDLTRPCMRPCHTRRLTKRRRERSSSKFAKATNSRIASCGRHPSWLHPHPAKTMSQRRGTNNGQGRLLRIARRQERRLGG